MNKQINQPSVAQESRIEQASTDRDTSAFVRLCQWLIGIAVASRLLAMAVIPLTDTTEARYAEIARKMLESQNWVTLWHDYGVPFWAKPPLSTWVSAASMQLFGVNAFAARLPNLLLMAGLIALCFYWLRKSAGNQRAWLAATILSTMLLTYSISGTVMTDISLVFSTTLSMVSFWYAWQRQDRRWGWLFFASLGLGLLAKGPVAMVFAGIAIVPWLCWQRQPVRRLLVLPWVSGTLLMCAIALPWYMLAEHRTPGFLHYFIVGEYLSRFLIPGWQGDLYGNAHNEPMGTIIVFWVAAAFPWCLALLGLVSRRLRRHWTPEPTSRSLRGYLLCWALVPLVFVPCRNIIPTYPLVGLPAAALLMAIYWPKPNSPRHLHYLTGLGLTSPLIALALSQMALADPSLLPKASQQPLSQAWHAIAPNATGPLYYVHKRYYSAEFYNRGNTRVIEGQQLDALKQGYVAMLDRQYRRLPVATRQRLRPLLTRDLVTLYHLRPAQGDARP